MKVLQINVYNYRKGGSEAVYFNTSEVLRKNGHTVINFTLKWKDNYHSEYAKYFPESKETRRGIFRQFSNAINYFYHDEAAEKLEQLIINERPDIAQIHLIWGQISPSILPVLKRYNIPIIFTIHDYRIVCPAYTFRNGKGEICHKCGEDKFYNCFLNKCTKGSYIFSAMMGMEQYFRNRFYNPAEYADGLIYVSNFAKEMHERYMPALSKIKNIVLYNTSDHIFDSKIHNQGKRYYLYFGRLSHEKGLKTLIDAFTGMSDEFLKIAGTGPLEAELRKSVAEKGAQNIEFLGYKSGEELQNLVRNAYFIIVPSEWYENNPLTIIEGYSAWVPVIGAKIGGIPEIIEEGKTGYIFNHSDIEQLIASVKKASNLNEQEYLQFCENAHNFAVQKFNPTNYPSSILNFYSLLTAQHL